MLLILVGKSGCGKSTIEKEFPKMISFTTRKPREGEVHGKDYYFYDKEVIEKEAEKFKNGEETFIKQLSSYLGEYYGTSVEEVNRIKSLNENVVAVMNIEGAKDMKKIMNDNGVEVRIVWVDIDEDLRIERMMERMKETSETEEEVRKRLNEDYRDIEKEKVDVVIDNNGTLRGVLDRIKCIK